MNAFYKKKEMKAPRLRELWNKYLSTHFFRKALLAYFLTAVVAGVVLLVILSNNLVTIKTEQTLDMSSQIIDSVDHYLTGKIASARSIHQKLTMDQDHWRSITSHLKEPLGDTTNFPNYSALRQIVNQTIYAIDSQFYGLFFYSNTNDDTLLFVKTLDSNDQDFFTEWARMGSEDANIYLKPAHSAQVRNNAYAIFVLSQVSDPDLFTREIGVMGLAFSSVNIHQAYRRFDHYLKGKLQVVDKNGDVLYDSQAIHTLPEDYPFQMITRNENGFFYYGDSIYNTVYNPRGDYYVINIVPKTEVQKDIKVVQRSIQLVIIAVLALAVILTYGSSYRFNRRLRSLMDVMGEVRLGKLTGHPAPSPKKDEIGVIHAEFLSVCDSLEDYIQREYVYQIKQKEMEFYALQAQIDPHFLYNSLEAIRMKLLLTGEKETGRMIRILSEMFRSIMREDTVVDIRDEIRYLRDYLDLYKFRLGDKLEYTIKMEEDVYHFATIRHILQPVIENALIHGFKDVNAAENPGKLSIVAKKEGDDICFLITDNGKGISSRRLEEINVNLDLDNMFQKSVGIYNVNNRLRIIYGKPYRLQIESSRDCGTTVHLRIKAMSKKELRSFVQGVDRGR